MDFLGGMYKEKLPPRPAAAAAEGARRAPGAPKARGGAAAGGGQRAGPGHERAPCRRGQGALTGYLFVVQDHAGAFVNIAAAKGKDQIAGFGIGVYIVGHRLEGG